MKLIKILKVYQKKFIINQIIFLFLILSSFILLLVNLVVGLYLPKTIFWLLVPIAGYVLYKEIPLITLRSIASNIEKRIPELTNKIVPVVELTLKIKTFTSREGYSIQLINAASNQVSEFLSKLRAIDIINQTKTKVAGIVFGCLIVALFSIRIFIPEHFTIGSKLLLTNPNNLIKVSISPGNLIVNKDTIILIKYQY
ncbi:MAG: hypothetical protein N2166_02140, partial [candidate division WOR-3 bacterium]|nr:hypothetical protein [candidate division WOR-3 bacterium]